MYESEKNIKHIAIVNHVENIKILHADSILASFFTDCTVVAEPLPDDMDEEVKAAALEKRKEILCLVKQKIDEVLNPSKPEYLPSLSKEDIFQDVGITKEQYQWALSVSPDSDYELHLKRPIDQLFYQQLFHCWYKEICCQCRFPACIQSL